jgi:hypothetical protein
MGAASSLLALAVGYLRTYMANVSTASPSLTRLPSARNVRDASDAGHLDTIRMRARVLSFTPSAGWFGGRLLPPRLRAAPPPRNGLFRRARGGLWSVLPNLRIMLISRNGLFRRARGGLRPVLPLHDSLLR